MCGSFRGRGRIVCVCMHACMPVSLATERIFVCAVCISECVCMPVSLRGRGERECVLKRKRES